MPVIQLSSNLPLCSRQFALVVLYYRFAIVAGDKKEAVGAFAAMQKNVDQAVNKGLIHKNQAARKKSRLSAQIKTL